MIKIGIVGGTGYTGVELLRLLVKHPSVNIYAVTSRGEAGTRVADIYPNLRKHLPQLTFTEPTLDTLAACDLVFFATPNGTAMKQAPELLSKGVKIIDLAADFRLNSVQDWESWYAMPHSCPDLLAEAVYGLPEVNRAKIAQARLVANPGCYPTAIQLGLLPLLEAGLIDTSDIIADAKSGTSGAGRKAEVSMLMGETGESFKAYNASKHRHTPEITQEINKLAGHSVNLTFVPHLVPMVRGMQATLYVNLLEPNSTVDLQALYQQRYQNELFVDVLPFGGHPETRSVRGANDCQIAVHRPNQGKKVIILSVIDNLVKGAAGQAVQNMNIMFGLPETNGLENVGLLP